MPRSIRKKSNKKSNPAAAIATASHHLTKAEEALPFDDDLIERDRHAAIALIKFPTEALEAAREIVEKEPVRLSAFDLDALKHAIVVDADMKPLMRQADALVTAIQRGYWKQRANGIEQALALYAYLKRAARRDGSFEKYVEALAPHVAIRRRSKRAAAEPSQPPVVPANAPPAAGSAATHAGPSAGPATPQGASAPAGGQ